MGRGPLSAVCRRELDSGAPRGTEEDLALQLPSPSRRPRPPLPRLPVFAPPRGRRQTGCEGQHHHCTRRGREDQDCPQDSRADDVRQALCGLPAGGLSRGGQTLASGGPPAPHQVQPWVKLAEQQPLTVAALALREGVARPWVGAPRSAAVWVPEVCSGAGRRVSAGPATWAPAQLRACRGRGPPPPARLLSIPLTPAQPPQPGPPSSSLAPTKLGCPGWGGLPPQPQSPLQHVDNSTAEQGSKKAREGLRLGRRGLPRETESRGGPRSEADLGSCLSSVFKDLP